MPIQSEDNSQPLQVTPCDVRAPRAGLAFAALALIQATLIFTIALIMIPLPRIAQELALDSTDTLLLQVAYGLPFSGLLLFGGRMADRYRGRRMLVLGLWVFGGASFVAAMAADFTVLASMRFLQGVGAALIAPAALSVLRSLLSEPAEFGRAMATWGGVSVLGAVVGFVASGILTTWMSWRWMFAVPVLVSAMGLWAVRSLMPDVKAKDQTSRPALDLGGAVLATVAIVSSSIGLIASEGHAWTSPVVLWPLVAGIALFTIFLLVEGSARDPLLPPRFLVDRQRAIGLIGMLLAAAGSTLAEFVLLFYFQEVREWSSLTTAASFLPFVACLLGTNHLAPILVQRIGAARVVITGFLIGAAGLAVLASIQRDTSYAAVLLPGQLLLAVGISLVFSGAAVLSMANVFLHQAGLAGGVMNTAMELGPTMGLAVLMSIAALPADPVAGYGWAFGAAAIVYLGTAICAAALAKRSGPSAVKADGAEPKSGVKP